MVTVKDIKITEQIQVAAWELPQDSGQVVEVKGYRNLSFIIVISQGTPVVNIEFSHDGETWSPPIAFRANAHHEAVPARFVRVSTQGDGSAIVTMLATPTVR